MKKSKYVLSLFLKRAVDGGNTAENIKPNGLLRAIRNVLQSMCDGVWLSVNKGLHMSVCVKRALSASSRVAPQGLLHPVPALLLGQDFFIFSGGN